MVVSVADRQLEELVQANMWLAGLDAKNATQNASLDYLLTAAIVTNQAASDAVNAQIASDVQKASDAKAVIDAANAAAEAARLAAEVAASQVVISAATSPVGYSATNPNPALVTARNEAIAAAQYEIDYGSGRFNIRTGNAMMTAAMQLPTFASGGDHMGGLRIVGENGIELESTGPSRITNTNDIMAALRNPQSNNEAMVAEIRALREEVSQLRKENKSGQIAIATNTGKAAKILDKFDGEGLPEVREA